MLLNNVGSLDLYTTGQAQGLFAKQPTFLKSSSTMSDLLSLSVFQVLSILSFLTSIFAVVRVGSGTLNRFSPRIDSDVGSSPHMNIGAGKPQPWQWSSLPSSFSIGALIGEDERADVSKDPLPDYVGGSELVRMNWQVSKQRTGRCHGSDCLSALVAQCGGPQFAVPPMYNSQPPLSMAKLIMSRQVSPIIFYRFMSC